MALASATFLIHYFDMLPCIKYYPSARPQTDASGKHLGGIWGYLELSGAIWAQGESQMHLGGRVCVSEAGIWGASGTPLRTIWGYLGPRGALEAKCAKTFVFYSEKRQA